MDYTLILNFFNKSEELLILQLKKCEQQTIKPHTIFACFFGPEEKISKLIKVFKQYTKNWKNTYCIESNFNFMHMGRYQIALGAPTEYIVMLDDDRFPQPSYCETMIGIISKRDCLLAQYGWKLDHSESLKSFQINGTSGSIKGLADMTGQFLHSFQNGKSKKASELHEVDYLCGGATFRKASLRHLFSDSINYHFGCDDICFCLRCRKAGIASIVYIPDGEETEKMALHDSGGVNVTVNCLDTILNRSKLLQSELGMSETFRYQIDNEIK
jgi:hypothetical protein